MWALVDARQASMTRPHATSGPTRTSIRSPAVHVRQRIRKGPANVGSRWILTTVLLLFGLVAACAPPHTAANDVGPRTDGTDGQTGRPDRHRDERQVRVSGRDIVLRTSRGERVLHTLGDEDGDPVHVSRRPSHHTDTVLLVTRVIDAGRVRYELRYLVAADDRVTDLYWFPWRLQIDEDLAQFLDVVPIPVWSPTGDAIAWVEWNGEGTWLRTVGWIDDGISRNPSDEAEVHPLPDIPAGVQLDAWERTSSGSVLRGHLGEQTYRIELDEGVEHV